MDSGVVIGGFKAVGKSTLAKKYSNVVDLESSDFKYIIDKNMEELTSEERKGLKNRTRNPDYPLNYLNAIIYNLKKNNIVLIACKTRIIELLEKNSINYYIVYPEDNMLDEIIQRSKNRGNNKDFIAKIRQVYYEDYPKNKDKVIWLQKGQYLEDVLIEKGIL